VFLFDDVLSELDSARREYLLHHMQQKQVILTTCDQIQESDGFRMIRVKAGTYTF
jgi:recombinational DNA repair ATPase RecF